MTQDMPETGPVMLVDGQVEADAEVIVCESGLSFWGGVDPVNGRIIDVHHPNHGEAVAGKVLMMPSSRGSCSGSGVLLQLALTGQAPAALVFCEDEEILTLGAMVAARLFGRAVPVFRLPRSLFDQVSNCRRMAFSASELRTERGAHAVMHVDPGQMRLSDRDREMLAGSDGPAVKLAMDILCRMAVARGATELVDVTRGHIDGCILAHDANLIFAERLLEMGARVAIPTTINAISVDRENWPTQGVAPDFGSRASRLADAYVKMGARPTFTCAPYLLPDAPFRDELLGWSESNAVIYANSVLGARTAKHPDYLDLFIAMTGRAPLSGIYTDAGRVPERILAFSCPDGHDESLWSLVGWISGRLSPDRIPLLTGFEGAVPGPDDLKALCAAFGTTSGAPMLHVAGHTPEAGRAPSPIAGRKEVSIGNLASAWDELNCGEHAVDLVAIGSPHSSLQECRRLADLFDGRRCGAGTQMIVTLGRDVLQSARDQGVTERLEASGVQLIPDLCWCSITTPVLRPDARVIMTNSGKYAHYAPGLSGRHIRLGSLADCVAAAITGRAPEGRPPWLDPPDQANSGLAPSR